MYQVLHANKIKTEIGLTCKAKHNSREEIYNDDLTLKNPDRLPEWIKKDLSDAEKRLQSNAERATDVLSLRNEKMQNLARKPQKNASAAIEFVISASPDFQGDWQDFFDKSKEFLVKKFGENVISCAVHADETTPHMHIIFVPIIEKDGKKRYSSSQFLGGRDGMKKLHTQFYEEVGQFFGLERGEENSRAKHDTAREFSKKIKEVEKKEEVLELNKRILQTEKRIVDGKERDVSEREKKLTAREEEVFSAEKKLDARQQNILEQEKFYGDFQKDIEKYQAEYMGQDIKSYRAVIPNYTSKSWEEVNSAENVKKNFKFGLLSNWDDVAEKVAKFCIEKSKKLVQPFQDEFNKLYDRLKKATAVIQRITENYNILQKENDELKNENTKLKSFDYRKFSATKLFELAQEKQVKEQRQNRNRSSGFER